MTFVLTSKCVINTCLLLFIATEYFFRLYDYRHNQEDVFSTCTIPIIEDVLEGYNGCIFAYGQTGAGTIYVAQNKFGVFLLYS